MKKLLLIILVVLIILISGCRNASDKTIKDYKELAVNKDIISNIEKGSRKIVGSVDEYSYISQAGKITGSYELNDKESLVFVSKGLPDETNNINGDIYIDESKNYILCTPIKTDNGTKYIEASSPTEGIIFDLKDPNFKSFLDKNNGIIDINDSINKRQTDAIACFYNTIFTKGHISKVSLNNSLYRETFYGNEQTDLVKGPAWNIHYYKGRIYYLCEDKLYSINVDGTDNKLISNINEGSIIDYLINDQGIVLLTSDGGNKCVMYQKYGMNDYNEILEFNDNSKYEYLLISVEGDIVYLSRKDIQDSWIEILQIDNSSMKILNHTDKYIEFYFHPFKNGDDIYYIVNDGIYRYNIKVKTDVLIATFLCSLETHIAGTPVVVYN